jgi:hypothetical protein
MLQVNKPHPRQEVIVTGSSRSLYAWRPRPSGGADPVIPCSAGACKQLHLCLLIRSAAVNSDCVQHVSPIRIVCECNVPGLAWLKAWLLLLHRRRGDREAAGSGGRGPARGDGAIPARWCRRLSVLRRRRLRRSPEEEAESRRSG